MTIAVFLHLLALLPTNHILQNFLLIAIINATRTAELRWGG